MTYLRCIYDLRRAPITFDFGIFLALADCARQLLKRDSLEVTIRHGDYRNSTPRDKSMDEDEKEWRVKMLADIAGLLPTISTLTVTDHDLGPFDFPVGYPDAYFPYTAGFVSQYHEKGADPRVFTAPAYAKELARREKPYVTLTLRQSRHFPERNIDLEAWSRFAAVIESAGYDVVTIQDQESTLQTLDLRLRMALYEGAVMNIGPANGPVALMFFSKAPVIQFDQLRGGAFNPAMWMKLNGFPVGQQFPWSADNQRMTWTDSTPENLEKEWNAWISQLSATASSEPSPPSSLRKLA